MEKPALLLVNQGPAGNWLHVKARGTHSNTDAIGARVEVHIGERTLVREVSSTTAYITGQSLVCHFGLGDVDVVDEVQVHWPRGGVTRLKNVACNQRLEIVEAQPPTP